MQGCNSKLRDELRTALAQEELMLSKVQGALAALQQVRGGLQMLNCLVVFSAVL